MFKIFTAALALVALCVGSYFAGDRIGATDGYHAGARDAFGFAGFEISNVAAAPVADLDRCAHAQDAIAAYGRDAVADMAVYHVVGPNEDDRAGFHFCAVAAHNGVSAIRSLETRFGSVSK